MIATSDGGYVATGLEFPDTSNQYNKHDVGLVKINSDKVVEWGSAFGKSWASHDQGRSVVESPDGGFLIGGITKADNLADEVMWLIKTDSEGNLEWERTYNDAPIAGSIVNAHDGGYVITAGSQIFKITSDGQFFGEVGIVQPSVSKRSFSINQQKDLITFAYPALRESSNYSVSIMDLKGKLLGTNRFINGRAQWSVPSGLSGVVVLRFNLGEKSFSDRFHLIN